MSHNNFNQDMPSSGGGTGNSYQNIDNVKNYDPQAPRVNTKAQDREDNEEVLIISRAHFNFNISAPRINTKAQDREDNEEVLIISRDHFNFNISAAKGKSAQDPNGSSSKKHRRCILDYDGIANYCLQLFKIEQAAKGKSVQEPNGSSSRKHRSHIFDYYAIANNCLRSLTIEPENTGFGNNPINPSIGVPKKLTIVGGNEPQYGGSSSRGLEQASNWIFQTENQGGEGVLMHNDQENYGLERFSVQPWDKWPNHEHTGFGKTPINQSIGVPKKLTNVGGNEPQYGGSSSRGLEQAFNGIFQTENQGGEGELMHNNLENYGLDWTSYDQMRSPNPFDDLD